MSNSPLGKAFTNASMYPTILGTTNNFFSIHHNTKSTMSPKIISIEANIGAGKSTLLNRLEKRGYTVVYEPIDEWTHGDNLLQHMYQDPKRYMLTFQTYALTTRVKALREALSRHNHKDEVIFVERAPGISDLHIFIKLAMQDGNMTPLEQCVYANLHTTIMEDKSIHTDQIVYLAPPTETAFERIHSRARPGEEGIQCSLIYKLAKLHEEYLGVRKDVYQMPDNENTDIEVMLGELVPTRVRGVQQLFPIQDEEAWGYYQTQIKSFWTAGELDFGHDGADMALMSTTERGVLLQTLAFFASSDIIVNDRLVTSIIHDLPNEEWRCAITTQCFMETIHTETYNRLIDALVASQDEKAMLFNALNTIPSIRAKRDFYMQYSDPSNDFQTRLLCQLLVEGVHFSASFALIAWLRRRHPGRFEATTKANELIMRDEGLHAKMACSLLKRELNAGKTVEQLIPIVKEAVRLEQAFIRGAFRGEWLFLLNEDILCLHVQTVADYWLTELGQAKIYGTPNQIDWLEGSTLECKSNFFETRPTEYQRLDRCEFSIDADF